MPNLFIKNVYLKFNEMKKLLVSLLFSFFAILIASAQRSGVPIGTSSNSAGSGISISLIKRFQHYNANTKNENDVFDVSINSPKSVNILNSKNKFYVNSLEGEETAVYDLTTFKKIKIIKHSFNASNQYLFKGDANAGFIYKTKTSNLNYFNGKPVESCFSHNGKYLWITYYRKSYDANAIDPSAVCIIDTDADTIVRVMTTASLPKMIACSPDSKTIAISHWGDNTVSLIDVSSGNPQSFSYLDNIVIDYKMNLNFSSNAKIDRDNNCGNCLRGTEFTPDNKYILVGKMGGNGIAIIDIEKRKYLGTVTGMKTNMRHLLIKDSMLYLSSNKYGYVQKTLLYDFVNYFSTTSKMGAYNKWQNAFVGIGARTISIDPSGKYLFAAVNNESKVSIVRTSDMKVLASCNADSYPVGMDMSEDGKTLIVTAQGKTGGGGNSVMVFKVKYGE
jgi:DNA-binding beta-propeller fold protein YncE